jgi:hypothetical protein
MSKAELPRTYTRKIFMRTEVKIRTVVPRGAIPFRRLFLFPRSISA